MSVLPKLPTFETAHLLVTTPRHVEWLVHAIMPPGSLGVLFGDPGVGKSLLAQALSCAIASGVDWLGRPVTRGCVAYVAGEGYGGLGRRLAAWAKQNEVALEGAPVYFTPYSNFLDDENIEETIDEFKGMPGPVGLIVVDTMARSTPGMNEDRANEVSKFVDNCEQLRDATGATVLVLHHSPHSDKTRAKGSIALRGAVDFELGLLKTSEDGVVRLTCTKLKDGEPFPDIFLRFQPVEVDGTTSVVLLECDAPSGRSGSRRKVRLSANDKLFLLTLGSEPVEEATVRTAFLKRHPSGSKESAAKGYLRARRRGLERQWFVEDGRSLIPSTAAIMRDHTDSSDGQGEQ